MLVDDGWLSDSACCYQLPARTTVQQRERLGWNDFFQAQIADDAPPPQIARVIEEQRGAYRVAGDFEGWAEISGKFRHDVRDV